MLEVMVMVVLFRFRVGCMVLVLRFGIAAILCNIFRDGIGGSDMTAV